MFRARPISDCLPTLTQRTIVWLFPYPPLSTVRQLGIWSIAEKMVPYVRSFGIRGYLQDVINTATDRWFEWRLGIDTSGDTNSHVADHGDSVGYVPIPYALLRKLLSQVPMGSKSSFLDYGAGRGRVVAIAAQFPLRRVTGVELSPRLAEDARANLHRAKRLVCQDVVIVNADAADFHVPDDVDVIHFFKPFRGRTLEQVLDKIEDSYRRAPRKMTIIFFNDEEFQERVRARPWLEHVQSGIGLQRTKWPIRWGLYEADGDAT